ncbi:MAG: LiaF transmembrane domain-containing protein [Bacteroidia bacterium]
MTTLEDQFHNDEQFKNWEQNQRRGRTIAGIVVIIAAVLFFCKELGYFIPSWVFTWPVLLIVIGLISGIKHQFRNTAWIILMAIGGIFLAGDLITDFSFDKFKIPIILLIVGLILVFKPKNRYRHYAKYKCRHYQHTNVGASQTTYNSSDDFVMMNNVFAGTKKNVISKDFKGGEINNTFGGCELNLIQADIVNEAVITINQHLGGTKLIIPPNWAVKSDVVCVFGGIEDERPRMAVTGSEQTKTLILRGRVFMGGVEIVSY